MASNNVQSPIQAVVFDLDGVLIDSEEWWDQVRSGLAADSGVAWPADATRRMQGMSTPEWSGYLAQTVGIPGTADDIAREVVDAMAARYAKHLPLLPGAVGTVQAIANRWPVAIASSSPRTLIDVVLGESDLARVVSASFSTEEVAAGKPSPVVYQAAVAALESDPTRTVAVEDSSNGLRSAHAAGLIVVAVPNPKYPPATDALGLAAATIATIADLTPDFVSNL